MKDEKFSFMINAKPALEKFLAELDAASTEDERSWLSLQFNLSAQPAKIQVAIFAAAVPYWFDMAMLDFMLDFKLTDSERRTILSLPYIERYDTATWNVHEKTRVLLRKQLKAEDDLIFKKFSKKAAAWARKQRSKGAFWTVEAIYHSILAGEKGAEEAAVVTGINLLNHHRYPQLEAFTQHILEASEAGLINSQILAWAWFFIGRMDMANDRIKEAESAVLEVQRLCGTHGKLLAESNFLLGQVRLRQGHPKHAAQLFESAAQLFDKNDLRIGAANAVAALGIASSHVADLKKSAICYEKAKRIYIELKEPYGHANCEYRQGELDLYNGNFTSARKHFDQAKSIYRKVVDHNGLANCHMYIGRLAFETANFDEAKKQYDDAFVLYTALGSDLGRLNILREQGEVKVFLKEFEEANVLLQEGLKLAKATGDALSEANCLRAIAVCNLEAGSVETADDFLKRAQAIYVDRGYFFGELSCLLSFGRLDEERRRFDLGLQKYLTILGHLSAADVPRIRSVVLGQMAQHYLNHLDLDKAASFADMAVSVKSELNSLLLRAEISILRLDFPQASLDLESAAVLSEKFVGIGYVQGKMKLWQGFFEHGASILASSAGGWVRNGEISLWSSVAQSILGANFLPILEAGLANIYRPTTLLRFSKQLSAFSAFHKINSLDKIEEIIQAELRNRNINL